jgi:hypothetical protein
MNKNISEDIKMGIYEQKSQTTPENKNDGFGNYGNYVDKDNNDNKNYDLKIGHFSNTPPLPPQPGAIQVLVPQNTAAKVIDFAKEQVAKITDANAKGAVYSEDIINNVMETVRHMIDAVVRIEAINKLSELNITEDEIIREIFTDALFRN